MSAVIQPAAVPAGPKALEDDPYRLGWRYLTRRQPDGTAVCDQVPLTPEDVLHPEEEDFIVQTDGHNIDRDYLYDVFKYRLRERDGAIVLCDHRIAWDVPGLRPLGPDIMVIFNVPPGPRLPTFDVAREGTRPSLIVEITSPATRDNDLGIKVDYYYRAGISNYVIVDAREDDAGRHIALIGYQRAETGYIRQTLNEQGWLWFEPLQIWLGVKGERVACFQSDGKEILHYPEVAAERDALAARMAEVEARAAAESQARSDAEARAAAESQARSDAERKLHELEEEMRRLRGQG